MSKKKISSVIKATERLGKRKKFKEKRAIEECPHHYYNSHGKLKRRFRNCGDGTVICKLCGRRHSSIPYDKEEIKFRFRENREVVDQAIFMACEAGMAQQADFLVTFGSKFKEAEKVSKGVIKSMRRLEEIEKKKKGKNNPGGSAQFLSAYQNGRHSRGR